MICPKTQQDGGRLKVRTSNSKLNALHSEFTISILPPFPGQELSVQGPRLDLPRSNQVRPPNFFDYSLFVMEGEEQKAKDPWIHLLSLSMIKELSAINYGYPISKFRATPMHLLE